MAAKRPHSTRAWRALASRRVAIGRAAGEPCAMCGQAIDYQAHPNARGAPTADHLTPLAVGGLVLPPLEELQVVHKSCNSRQGAALANAQRRGGAGESRAIPQGGRASSGAPQEAPPPFRHLSTQDRQPSPGDHRGRALDVPGHWADVPWMADLLPVPDDATWPAAMSDPHPRAVGSLGQEAEVWLAQAMGLRLRWWQRLAFRRSLEVDDAGHLVWPSVVETTPRRAGKSVRLRSMALWRLHQAQRLGETQLVMFTAKDMQVAKEVLRPAMAWADGQGYKVLRGAGTDAIEHPDGSRWLMRGQDSVYGYDVCLGMVDEAWSVRPGVVDDGLEPALLERVQPQLVLTSTAHRRATALMRGRMAAALADEGDALLLRWSAPAGAEVGDPVAWRAASPHWSEGRAELLGRALRRIAAGQADPDPLEPDPVEAFRSQYLNHWAEARPGSAEWLPRDQVEACGSLTGPVGPGLAGAMESALDGRSWAVAVADGSLADVALGLSLTDALAWLRERHPVVVVAFPATVAQVGVPTSGLEWHKITSGEQVAATQALAQAVRQGAVHWRGPVELRAQFARVVLSGRRVSATRSLGPVEGVAALSWAHWWAGVNGADVPAVF